MISKVSAVKSQQPASHKNLTKVVPQVPHFNGKVAQTDTFVKGCKK